jgi:hypothetical protein
VVFRLSRTASSSGPSEFRVGPARRMAKLPKRALTRSNSNQSLSAKAWRNRRCFKSKTRGCLAWRPLSFQTKRAMSPIGTKRTFAAPQHFGRYWTKSGQRSAPALNGLVANDSRRPQPNYAFTSIARFTVMGCHRLPCGVSIPRSLRASARPV